MIESLVITLREGIEAALVVGIILAYLSKSGNSHLNRKVYLGLAVAVAASIAFASVFQVLGIDPENEYLEGTMYSVAAVMVASLVVWMWRAGKGIKTETEKKLASVISRRDSGSQGWGLFLFTFFMVFREGAETVLFLMSATLGKFDLLSIVGGIAGIILALAFAMFFIKGSLRINLSRFFTVTGVVLLLLALKLALSGLHEFGEVGVIPLTQGTMAVIGFFVRGSTSSFILMALLAAPLLVVMWDAKGIQSTSTRDDESSTGRRKRLAARKQERVWRGGLVVVALLVMFAMAYTMVSTKGPKDPAPQEVAVQNGVVSIPVASLVEGEMAKFSSDVGEARIRVMAIRDSQNAVHVALDACQICGGKGYGQDGSEVVCKNCNAPIATDSIGQGGGCNPLPVAYKVESGNIMITVQELSQLGSAFR